MDRCFINYPYWFPHRFYIFTFPTSTSSDSKMKRIFFIFLLLLVIFSFSSKSVAEEEEEEGEEREFDYRGKKGPANWGDLKEEWYHCKNGTMQSPINIDMFNVTVRIIPGSMSMKKRYKPFYGIVKNRGHDISIRWKDNKAGYIEINGSRYFLHQAHWHSPSEHTINGKRYIHIYIYICAQYFLNWI